MFIFLQKFDPADFDECIYKDPAAADMLAGKSLAIFAEVLKEWEGCEKYAERFEVFKTEYLSRVLKTYAINKSEFGYNVLNHADFHINNLLFKKNSDYKIEELMFVSFLLMLKFHQSILEIKYRIKILGWNFESDALAFLTNFVINAVIISLKEDSERI